MAGQAKRIADSSLTWIYCPSHADVNNTEVTNQLASEATTLGTLQMDKADPHNSHSIKITRGGAKTARITKDYAKEVYPGAAAHNQNFAGKIELLTTNAPLAPSPNAHYEQH